MPLNEDAALSETVTGQAAVLSELVAAFLDGTLRRSGLSLGAFELLSSVKASPAATQAALAERLGITPSSLCEAVQSAVGKGLIEQEPFPGDRRAKRIRLTRKGGRALDEAIEALKRAEEVATAGLSETAVARSVEVLRHCARSLSQEVS
jgi:DNA-binding MarR family transcriptional regulator